MIHQPSDECERLSKRRKHPKNKKHFKIYTHLLFRVAFCNIVNPFVGSSRFFNLWFSHFQKGSLCCQIENKFGLNSQAQKHISNVYLFQ